jgi:hypothetical protein
MKGWQSISIVGALTLTGIHPVSGNSYGATAPNAMLGAAITAKTPGAGSLTATVPDAFGGLGTALGAELGLASRAVSGTSLAKAEIGDCYFYPRRDAAQPVPTTRNVSDEASKPEPATQDFRYLTYYVYSELPPAEKPADIVLSSFKDTASATARAVRALSAILGPR